MNIEKELSIIDRCFQREQHNSMSSPTREAFNLIRRNRPHTRADFEKLFKLKYLGRGCSRAAYLIEGTTLVVKFEDHGTNGTDKELECYQRLRKHREALKYTMQILYHAPGILVLPKYEHLPESEYIDSGARRKMTTVFKMAGVGVADLHYKNVMRDRVGNVRCTDMGDFWICRPENEANNG